MALAGAEVKPDEDLVLEVPFIEVRGVALSEGVGELELSALLLLLFAVLDATAKELEEVGTST